LRIISGDAKGRRLVSPLGNETRPTSDRVKESLFNILGDRVPDSSVLDLFAGTGNLGLEALSRGASHCIFIDNSRESIKVVNQNIDILKYRDYCEVYDKDALSALNILSKRDIRFNIIFLDPPYHKEIVPQCLEKIELLKLLSSNGIIVAEHDIRDEIPERIGTLCLIKKYIYRDTALSLYWICDVSC
jgi:RNA methyltransferase, RsmD family